MEARGTEASGGCTYFNQAMLPPTHTFPPKLMAEADSPTKHGVLGMIRMMWASAPAASSNLPGRTCGWVVREGGAPGGGEGRTGGWVVREGMRAEQAGGW